MLKGKGFRDWFLVILLFEFNKFEFIRGIGLDFDIVFFRLYLFIYFVNYIICRCRYKKLRLFVEGFNVLYDNIFNLIIIFGCKFKILSKKKNIM